MGASKYKPKSISSHPTWSKPHLNFGSLIYSYTKPSYLQNILTLQNPNPNTHSYHNFHVSFTIARRLVPTTKDRLLPQLPTAAHFIAP